MTRFQANGRYLCYLPLATRKLINAIYGQQHMACENQCDSIGPHFVLIQKEMK